MSKVLIDRELLERVKTLCEDWFVRGHQPHMSATDYKVWHAIGFGSKAFDSLRTALAAPSGTPAMPVKAYYHEAVNAGIRTKSVGLEVRKEFTDAPLVLESDAMARVACLEGEIAKRDARIMGLESQYQRDVWGLNNEGDPIGGEPAGGYANDNARLRAELAAIKAQEPAAYIPVDRETGEEWHPVLKKGSGNICDYKPLYAAPASVAKHSAAELFSDVLMCQRNQVETLAGDPYMVGLYNGMSMMIANFDNSPDFECLSVSETKAQGVVMPERQDDQYGDQDAIGWNACIDEVARLNAAPVSEAKAQGVVMPEPVKCAECGEPTACGKILCENHCYEQPIARLNAAHVQQASVPDVSAMARILADRNADACNVNREDNWAIYGQDYIYDVKAMLATAPAAPATDAWISVSERLPGDQGHDSEEVLCFLNGHCSLLDNECRQGGGWGIRLGYYDADIGTFRVFGRPESHVTHWMPLPAAPSANSAKGVV